MLNPNPDILLYIGMADAFAAGAEYLKLPEQNDLLGKILMFDTYYPHPSGELHPGAYTDDTEMSIANAKVLLGQYHGKLDFADAYIDEFKLGNKRKGYAKGFQALLESIDDGLEFVDQIRPNSTKNGACMRAAVFGVLSSVEDVLGYSEFQAAITHNTTEGIFSAQAVALMAHFAMYTGWPFDLITEVTWRCLGKYPQFEHVFHQTWDGTPVVGNSTFSVAIATVHAVSHLLTECHSLMDMLCTLIQWGGDTDSVAAVAWGIASCRFREEKLPDFLYKGIENPTYLKEVGAQLMNKFNKD